MEKGVSNASEDEFIAAHGSLVNTADEAEDSAKAEACSRSESLLCEGRGRSAWG